MEAKIDKPRKRMPLSNVALLLVGTALIGQLLGLWRTKLINGNFPATGPHSTDAYFAAFLLPDLFFYTLAAGALSVAFIPVLTDKFHRSDRKAMWDLTSSLINLLSIVMMIVAALLFIFAEPLLKHLFKLPPSQLEDAVVIMRLVCLNPLAFTLSGILTSVQQTLGRFFFYAIAPLFYNLCIIGSIYIFRGTEFGLRGLGVGALVGGFLQLAIVCLGLFGTKFTWRPKIMWRHRDFRTVLRQLPPRSIDQGIDQIQSVVETRLAAGLGTGNITYYNNAYMLQMAPILLIGSAISSAAFPRLTARLSQGRPDLFRSDFLKILKFMIWISVPIIVVCYFARGYLARLIFTNNAPEIALIFGYLVAAIFFRILYSIMSRWFYARKDTKTPLFVSIFTIVFNIVLAMILARPQSYGIAGLALSVSLAAMAEVFILGIIMVRRDRGLLNLKFWGGVARIVSVGGFSVVAGYIAVGFFPLGLEDRGFVTLGTKLAIITLSTFCVHVAISGLFGLDEARPIFTWLKRLVLRPVRIN